MADIEGIHVNEFGKTVELNLKNDGTIQSLSGYSTGSGYSYTVKFWSEAPVKRWELNDSDATGPGASSAETAGIVKFTPTSDKNFDRGGDWEGQVWIEGTNTLLKSDRFTVYVKA